MSIEVCGHLEGRYEATKKKNKFYSFIHSPNKYLSSASHMLGTVPALKLQQLTR